MDKEELLEKMRSERPQQNLIEVVDFRESESGIEGVLYDVDVLVEHRFVYESAVTRLHKNMPYPLNPFKEFNDKKTKEMLKKAKPLFEDVFNFLKESNIKDERIGIENKKISDVLKSYKSWMEKKNG